MGGSSGMRDWKLRDDRDKLQSRDTESWRESDRPGISRDVNFLFLNKISVFNLHNIEYAPISLKPFRVPWTREKIGETGEKLTRDFLVPSHAHPWSRLFYNANS